MCNPISGITKSDGTIYMPDPNAWNHSHTEIAKLHGLPDGEWGDRFARWELTPKDGVSFRTDPDGWGFRLDEKRAPQWWTDDVPALEHAAREAVKRWLVAADRVVPGFAAIGGNHSTLTGGDGSTLTGGDDSTLTGGKYSTLTGGYHSTLTGGDRSTLEWLVWDGGRRRRIVRYTGEDGIEAGVAYIYRDGAVVRVNGGVA